MDVRLLGVLFMLAQAIVYQNVPPPGNAGLGRLSLFSILGAVISRPGTFIVTPFRYVGRGVGWLFGWNSPAALNNTTPAFAVFKYAVKEDRRAAIAIIRGQVKNGTDSGLVMIFVSESFYKGVKTCLTIIIVVGSVYLLYRVSKYVILRVRNSYKEDERILELKKQEKIKTKISELESEKEELKKNHVFNTKRSYFITKLV